MAAIEFVNIQLWPEENIFMGLQNCYRLVISWNGGKNRTECHEESEMKNVFLREEKSYKKHIRRT